MTVLLAEPPRLLRTVIFCGFVDNENSPRYRPPPSLVNVPISVFVDVTYTLKVALELLLVASTRNSSFPAEYSASWIDTVSAATVVGVRVGVNEGMALG